MEHLDSGVEAMTFQDCVLECSKNKSLVSEFDRLQGTHLSSLDRRKPIEQMIDEATGRDRAALEKFVCFVYECVWIRIPREKETE